jgi:hypothetical protein
MVARGELAEAIAALEIMHETVLAATESPPPAVHGFEGGAATDQRD